MAVRHGFRAHKTGTMFALALLSSAFNRTGVSHPRTASVWFDNTDNYGGVAVTLGSSSGNIESCGMPHTACSVYQYCWSFRANLSAPARKQKSTIATIIISHSASKCYGIYKKYLYPHRLPIFPVAPQGGTPGVKSRHSRFPSIRNVKKRPMEGALESSLRPWPLSHPAPCLNLPKQQRKPDASTTRN
jgi:hypothetical protein